MRMQRLMVVVGICVLAGGAFLAGQWASERGAATRPGQDGRKVLYYVDPMHPAYKSDKPGIAPDCGMELVPVYDDGGTTAQSGARSVPGTVRVTVETQQQIGVRVATVEKTRATKGLRVLGRVAVDENRTYRVIAAVAGWIEDVSTATTGSQIAKDARLASLFTPELYPAQQAYLAAMGVPERERVSTRDIASPLPRDPFRGNVPIRYRNALRNLGMTEAQVQELLQTRTVTEHVHIMAPADGVILARNISAGQRVEAGAELYRIADLRRVWILADVFENEARHLKAGMAVTVSLPNRGRTFVAKVAEVLTPFDATTRTLKVRLEADNPDLVLWPDMFVDVEVPVTYPAAVVVPMDAVVDSGLRQIVYVETAEGMFEPRRVEIGWRHGEEVEIAKGLVPGERIVVSGTFLVDSESRLKAAAAGIYGETSQDPVCNVVVDQSRARAANRTVTYQGQTFYFDSSECKAQFEREPARFAGPGSGAERGVPAAAGAGPAARRSTVPRARQAATKAPTTAGTPDAAAHGAAHARPTAPEAGAMPAAR
jgi:multidrug efflux pump subunit AcrA (membrane-fusion protein)/YHS domain-containing protein